MSAYWMFAAPAAAVVSLVFSSIKTVWIGRQDDGETSMRDISASIREGAMAYLSRQYKVLSVFVVVVAGLLYLLNARSDIADSTVWIAPAYVLGALCSAAAGYLSMRVATISNARTTAAARNSLSSALDVAFSGGAVVGMTIVGLSLLGLGLVFYFTTTVLFPGQTGLMLTVITGFSMGASSIALFARVGGGIYTKAADVGADLVGKIESGLPEDDPRNPAVIADNVGDNVGDVAGMGADLCESFIGAMVGAIVLGAGFDVVAQGDFGPLVLPLAISAVGAMCSILGTFLVKTKEEGNPQTALDLGAFGSAGAMAVAGFWITHWVWPAQGATLFSGDKLITANQVGMAIAMGIATGVAIGLITSYYCSIGKAPVNSIAEQSRTGAATNIIAGLAVGMRSTWLPVVVLVIGVLGSSYVAGLYGVAVAALGMLSTVGMQLAVDAYGPIADNAGGIAEMSHQDPSVRRRTDKLDAVGNTTAAIGKGFAIGSTAMTAIALFAAYAQQTGIQGGIDVTKPMVMGGMLLGSMLPFVFSSLAMKAVGEAAMEMIEEVRRQFREIKGLLEGTAKPDTARCVDISTRAAIRRMIAPGAIAITSPVAAGFLLGAEALGGLIAGVTVTGVMMAIFMANAGGAWDNAKKSFEGPGFKAADGQIFLKGSDTHKAAVVGDTVGDPFKDTAGPSLNALVKLTGIVALVIAPFLRG